jgi:hypothetical protein
MATLKVTTLNLSAELYGSNVFTVKLDAWRQSFYFWARNAQTDRLLLDGFNLADLAHDQFLRAGQNAGNGPLVLDFGGAIYQGRPIQLDDQLTFACDMNPDPTRNNARLLCVKQYFVPDRPGPDKLMGNQLRIDVEAQKLTRPPQIRPTATRPRPIQPSSSRPIRRDDR